MTLYDAIIVLGGGINEHSEIPPNVRLRVEESVRLLRSGVAPRIIMSGRWGYREERGLPITEAAAMKRIAVGLGADPSAILTEEESADTLGNAYFCKKLLLEPNRWRTVIVLVADHHAERAEFSFRKVLGPAYTIEIHPVVVQLSPEERSAKVFRHQKSLTLAHLWLDSIADGDDAAIWQLMQEKHPRYARNPVAAREEVRKLLEM